jgi:hypothetical protein
MVGTNNSNNDEWTEEQIAEGVQAIVQMLRANQGIVAGYSTAGLTRPT